MSKIFLGALVLCTAASAAMAQTGSATYIMNDQIQAVLKSGTATDRTLRVLDMGGYQLSVAVIHRGATAPGAASQGNATAAAAARPPGAPTCGLSAPPAGAVAGQRGMISHTDTVETYIVTSGSGTLITGGQIVNGAPSAPDSDVTRILNGPSCSGQVYGPTVSRVVTVGDVIVIPANVAHGWTAIADHVTYLSVRPDPKKVLQPGYVHPAIK